MDNLITTNMMDIERGDTIKVLPIEIWKPNQQYVQWSDYEIEQMTSCIDQLYVADYINGTYIGAYNRSPLKLYIYISIVPL